MNELLINAVGPLREWFFGLGDIGMVLWIVLKILAIAMPVIISVAFYVVWERKLIGWMHVRHGPMYVGMGIFQAFADVFKLLFKEIIQPSSAQKAMYVIAPLIVLAPAFAAWAVVPFDYQLVLSNANAGLLYLLAMTSLGVYGVIIAGWASNSKYPFLSSLRAAAQMISYEVAMGLSLVTVFIFSGSMSTSQIVESQANHLVVGGFDTHIAGHYWLLLIPSFVIYVITMFGESNRLPFDLPECESELVSGYITEYSGFPYGMYFLAEYINMATLSAVCTTLFLGGYRAPWPLNYFGVIDSGWWGLLWFFLKTQLVIFFFVWVRAAIPRFRYDHFMDLGWKVLIPVSLGWVLLVAAWRTVINQGWGRNPVFLVVVGVILVALIVWAFMGGKTDSTADEAPDEPFDAFAGGYPVPPLPHQVQAPLAGAATATTVARRDHDENGGL